VPALQYIGNVEDGGAAAEAGLCTGDFLLEVSKVLLSSSWLTNVDQGCIGGGGQSQNYKH
jgi:predicted metalloprotease with PDZ domain